MTKNEIISHIAKNSGATKKSVDGVLNALIELIKQTLSDKSEIRIFRLGTFKVSQRKARTGVNPRTGAKISIAAIKTPVFRAFKNLKDAAKGPKK